MAAYIMHFDFDVQNVGRALRLLTLNFRDAGLVSTF